MKLADIEACRELDKTIAQEIMGWRQVKSRPRLDEFAIYEPGSSVWNGRHIWNPSEDWRDAGRVIERMHKLGWRLVLSNFHVGDKKDEPEWEAEFSWTGAGIGYGATAPEAICKAALAALSK